jgi:NADH:ubiquinone oxidoreductase subunit 6 (subunit J)
MHNLVIPQRDEAPVLEKELIDKIDNDENGHRFYEVIYVGDHLITEHVPLVELPDMLLIIANIVSIMCYLRKYPLKIYSSIIKYSAYN